MSDNLNKLYAEHLSVVKTRFDQALAHTGFDAVIIGAGMHRYRFRDDLTYPFFVNSYLKQWVPLDEHPGSALIYGPGSTPRLVIQRVDDYWHQPPPLPGEPWSEYLEITIVTDVDEATQTWSRLTGHVALIGDPKQWPADASHINPPSLLRYLDYYRPYKTAYERECISRANRLAVPAHLAVAEAFDAGASEHDMLLRFLAVSANTQDELPYPAIIATNRNCATLHYQHYDRTAGKLHSLLIDAGCQFNGYAADISRSYSFADAQYGEMIADLDREQQLLCAAVKPGVSFVTLHREAHEAVARLLAGWGMVSGDLGSVVESGITRAFMPHGLGHYLGQQVHELGGLLANDAGDEVDRPVEFPNLRLARTLEVDQVLTIEPGIYFIDAILDELKRGPYHKRVNWHRVDALRKFGGMRIEDNLAVTPEGTENLTRQAFAAT